MADLCLLEALAREHCVPSSALMDVKCIVPPSIPIPRQLLLNLHMYSPAIPIKQHTNEIVDVVTCVRLPRKS